MEARAGYKHAVNTTSGDIPEHWPRSPNRRSRMVRRANGNICFMVLARLASTFGISLVLSLVASGCGGAMQMHSVGDVRKTFARHGLKLSAVERNRISTGLLPTTFVRALRRTPALGKLPRGPGYEVVVFTNRDWLRDLPHHRRSAQPALGTRTTDWSQFTTRHDNIFVVYPAGPPKNLPRLKRILDDI